MLPPTCVILGGFDLRAQAEIGTWRKLIEGLEGETTLLTIYLIDVVKPADLDSLRAMTPKSRWVSTLISSTNEVWRDMIQPDCPQRSFAGRLQNGVIHPLMIGPPTEDAWDDFSEAINRTAIHSYNQIQG